jgi:hypothetical protein
MVLGTECVPRFYACLVEHGKDRRQIIAAPPYSASGISVPGGLVRKYKLHRFGKSIYIYVCVRITLSAIWKKLTLHYQSFLN